MYQIDDQLAIYKFTLINRCLNAKGKDSSYLKNLRNKLVLVNELIKKRKLDTEANFNLEMNEIKEFISKTR